MTAPSAHAQALVAVLVMRIAEAVRSGRYDADAGAALAEQAEAAHPILEYVAELEQANATLWAERPRRLIERKVLRLAGRARRGDPNAERDAHFGARAAEHMAASAPTSQQPDAEEHAESLDAADLSGGFAGRVRRSGR